MKLTRRDFLKGGAITALALAVGMKAKIPETQIVGIGRGSPRILDNYGLRITGEMMEMAKAADALKTQSWAETEEQIYAYMASDQCYKSPPGTLFGYPIIWTNHATGCWEITDEAL